ncbi:MAG: ABC transporter permease [Arenimonas sp.]
MNTMKMLVKREYWENRGGFFWAPVIVSGIALLFSLIASIAGAMLVNEHRDDIHIQDAAEHAAQLGGVGDFALASGVLLMMAVAAFVLFFYAIGSLYDDRRDRSVLFWKSMPITDAQMVGSKVAWALLLAPLLSLGIGLVLGLAFWIVLLVNAAVSGLPGATDMITYSHPFRVVATLLAALPVQMLWALPTLGWLMLCSSWARRLPFLWATALPVLTGAMISFTDIFSGVTIAHDKVWYVIYRGLASMAPGSWIPTIAKEPEGNFEGPKDLTNLIDITSSWQVFGHADIWIGALIGIAMIVLSIRLRRYRDEG